MILFIADDQGECHYGSAGECRSAQSGTPIPAPVTPNLDILAANGTVFPIAHNTAAWCYPSLNSILTGRYQRSFNSTRNRIAERFLSIPRVLRTLGDGPGTTPDPFDPTISVGGYCSYLGGKFTAAAGDPGFDAGERGSGHRLGRLGCDDPGTGAAPRCGTERSTTYDPLSMPYTGEVMQFMDSMIYPAPGTSGDFQVQPFFVWYAPRIPHQPLDAPALIERYLFGSDAVGLGGVFQLGELCANGVCPPAVSAFDETNFGTVREFYGNVWWVDDNLRELRKFLERASQPHCRRNGAGRFEIGTPAQCTGIWAETIAPDLARNTAIVYLSDNGWHLPNSKHHYGENGYRTRMIVFDPRTLPEVPPWRAGTEPPPKPYESRAIAHSTDVLPTILGLALDTPGRQECPASVDGTPCDGRDLRPVLRDAPGGPAPSDAVRHSLCGHQTQRGTHPSRQRYIIPRPDAVGRCLSGGLGNCSSDAECAAGSTCSVGRCLPTSEPSCSTTTQCPLGAACLGGRCRVAPPCLDDATCERLLPGQFAACSAKGQGWCRNSPQDSCGTVDDCPACPSVNGRALPCGRVCEPRVVKLYIPPGDGGSPQFVDLFEDPDENARFGRDDGLMGAMSNLAGPYAPNIGTLACCVDEWWPDGARGGFSYCPVGATCPADLVCNQ